MAAATAAAATTTHDIWRAGYWSWFHCFHPLSASFQCHRRRCSLWISTIYRSWDARVNRALMEIAGKFRSISVLLTRVIVTPDGKESTAIKRNNRRYIHPATMPMMSSFRGPCDGISKRDPSKVARATHLAKLAILSRNRNRSPVPRAKNPSQTTTVQIHPSATERARAPREQNQAKAVEAVDRRLSPPKVPPLILTLAILHSRNLNPTKASFAPARNHQNPQTKTVRRSPRTQRTKAHHHRQMTTGK